MDFLQHFRQLDKLLYGYTWLWRPQPFKMARPHWCETVPELCATLLALGDEELARYTADRASLLELLADHMPALAVLESLTELPTCNTTVLDDPGPHFSAGIPGRKWRQIDAFSHALGQVQAPLLEWCGGKGHLGRLLAWHWRQPVLTLEREADLCEAGSAMAERVGAAQQFERCDVLLDGLEPLLAGRHAVALHACGELHRSLVLRCVAQGVSSLDLVPCCYHLHGEEAYIALTPGARLSLSRDDRRLAVTETVTAAGREVRLRDREMAWKLGFELLRRDETADVGYRPLRPIDKQWLNLDFPDFCRALAIREGVGLTAAIDWDRYERAGWQRQREVMRLSLVRHAFARAVEMWLVLDMACYLQSHDYRVSLSTFCERELTPRNILLSARRRASET